MNHEMDQSLASSADKWDDDIALFVRILLVHGMPPEWELGQGFPMSRQKWGEELRGWLYRSGLTHDGRDRDIIIKRYMKWCGELRRGNHGTMH